MGNRVYLELRGSNLPILVEKDEEDVARLTSSNSLPLFWLALLREEDLGGSWMDNVRAAFSDPEEFVVEPLCLHWREARENLASARSRAEARLPELFPLLRVWEAELLALAGQGSAHELRLDFAEYANFHDSADRFLEELHRGVHLWHGAGRSDVPPITDVGCDLTGFAGTTDEPFPATLPAWQPGRPVPGSTRDAAGAAGPVRTSGKAAEWGMVLLFVGIILGAALLGGKVLGPAGTSIGGGLGLIVACVMVWRWGRRASSR